MSKKPAVNAPCPCGSGMKYKKCCGGPSDPIKDYFRTATMLENAGLKQKPRLEPGVAPWKTDPESVCPCGSGNKYRLCCEPVILAHQRKLVKEAAKLSHDGDASGAVRLYKAHLVQYLEWVYAHTLPFEKARIPVIDQIVEVDIESITELSEAIAHCFVNTGRERDIPPFLEHVESIVPLESYEKPSAYLRALWLYIALNDDVAATKQLARLGDVLQYPKREAWELYLDIAGDHLSERQKISIAEKIIASAGENEHVRVQYTVLKALALIQIGESEEAKDSFDTLLKTAKQPSRIQTSDELSTQWQIAKALSMSGEIFADENALAEAESALNRIPEAMLKPKGIAALKRDLGWVLRDRKQYSEAADSFKESLQFDDSLVGRIHLIHALALSGRLSEGQPLLEELDTEDVPADLRLEYFGAKGAFAIASDDTDLATEAVVGLKESTMRSPFWDAQRSQLIIQLLDFVHQPNAVAKAKRQNGIIRVLVQMNEVLELKPNFFGLGLNLNKIIEKLTNRN